MMETSDKDTRLVSLVDKDGEGASTSSGNNGDTLMEKKQSCTKAR